MANVASLTKDEINEGIARMRDMARDPQKRAEMESAWGRVLDKLEPFYIAMRPKPKSFEVHHMNETARARFAHAIAAGRPIDECVTLAIEFVGAAP